VGARKELLWGGKELSIINYSRVMKAITENFESGEQHNLGQR